MHSTRSLCESCSYLLQVSCFFLRILFIETFLNNINITRRCCCRRLRISCFCFFTHIAIKLKMACSKNIVSYCNLYYKNINIYLVFTSTHTHTPRYIRKRGVQCMRNNILSMEQLLGALNIFHSWRLTESNIQFRLKYIQYFFFYYLFFFYDW